MSPFSIVGTKPLNRCRSEPQMAVDVILMMASRELRIFGSGTSSTFTFLLPSQQVALIGRCSSMRSRVRSMSLAGRCRRAVGFGIHEACLLQLALFGRASRMGPRVDAGIGVDHF